jgi:hypothetical protein
METSGQFLEVLHRDQVPTVRNFSLAYILFRYGEP